MHILVIFFFATLVGWLMFRHVDRSFNFYLSKKRKEHKVAFDWTVAVIWGGFLLWAVWP